MLTAKFSTKRVLGVVLATGLALTGTVAVAGNSEAATTATYTLSPKTGPAYLASPATSSAQVLTVTGKGFQVGTTSKVGSVSFVLATATCAATYGSQTLIPTAISVVSPTKMVVTTGTGATQGLPLSSVTAASTSYTMCVYDTTTAPLNATNKLIGTAKYAVYPVSAVTSINNLSTGAVSGSSFGGDTLSIVGTAFTKASVVRIDGVVAKTTFVDATDLTAVTPAHAAGTLKVITVTNEGGPVTVTPTFSYIDAIKVGPTFGDGTAGNVVTLTGSGFSSRTFASTSNLGVVVAAANVSVIQIVPAGTNTVTGATIAAYNTATPAPCTHVQVVSDTEVNCQLPDLTTAANAGPYSVQIVGFNGTVSTSVTAVSRSSVYTVSAF
jgi:IPT/TIG domain